MAIAHYQILGAWTIRQNSADFARTEPGLCRENTATPVRFTCRSTSLVLVSRTHVLYVGSHPTVYLQKHDSYGTVFL